MEGEIKKRGKTFRYRIHTFYSPLDIQNHKFANKMKLIVHFVEIIPEDDEEKRKLFAIVKHRIMYKYITGNLISAEKEIECREVFLIPFDEQNARWTPNPHTFINNKDSIKEMIEEIIDKGE